MIGTDKPMALVMSNNLPNVEIFYLGNATFDANEFDVLNLLAEKGGSTLELIPLEEMSFAEVKAKIRVLVHDGRLGDKGF
jgi:hypothetical protein